MSRENEIWGRKANALLGPYVRESHRLAVHRGKPGMMDPRPVNEALHNVEIAEAVRTHTEERMESETVKAKQEYEAATEAILAARNTFAELEEVVNGEIRSFHAALRDLRMSIRSELNSVLSDMKELREFALTQQHVEQVNRLKELCDLCERLQAIHDSGLLGVVTDSIVQLMDSSHGKE